MVKNKYQMGWDCYAYTFIGVRIPQKILWKKGVLKHCECYDEDRYCEECSGDSMTSPNGTEFSYGYEIIDNDASKKYLYICISKELHDCKDEKDVVQSFLSLEELIQKRESLKSFLIEKELVKDGEEFRDLFGIYTRANYDY